jgi:hypothetical protein
MANKLRARTIMSKTLHSGAALSCRYVKFRFNYAPLDNVQGFDLYKLVNGAFVTLEHGTNSDWVMESHRDGNWYVMIRNTDASRSGPEMLNGIYVLRNRDTRKGKIITVRKTDEACDDPTELVYANFTDMNSAPYVSTISLRVTGKIKEQLTLNVLDKDENELASVVGGARSRRGQTELESVTNSNLEAKVVCTSSPCMYIADLVTEDGVFYVNEGDDISVTNDSPAFTQSVTMRTIRETLSSRDRQEARETPQRRESKNTTEDTTTNTVKPEKRAPSRETPREPIEDPRVAILERSLAEQAAETRRLNERLAQKQQIQQTQQEEGIDTTTKVLIGAIALGGFLLIYKKMKDKKAQIKE